MIFSCIGQVVKKWSLWQKESAISFMVKAVRLFVKKCLLIGILGIEAGGVVLIHGKFQ